MKDDANKVVIQIDLDEFFFHKDSMKYNLLIGPINSHFIHRVRLAE